MAEDDLEDIWRDEAVTGLLRHISWRGKVVVVVVVMMMVMMRSDVFDRMIYNCSIKTLLH